MKETSNTKTLAEKKTEPIKITQTVSTKEGENNLFESPGNTDENKIALTSKKIKNTESVATKLKSLPLIETAEVAENININNNFITPLSTQIKTSITVSTEHNTKSNSLPIPQKKSFIRIIDNIPKNLQPNNSADIKNR